MLPSYFKTILKRRCSDEDKSLGVCGDEKDVTYKHTSEDKPDDDGSQNTGPYIAVAVTLSVLLLITGVAFFLWRRHRRRDYNIEEFSALTYANPTYQKASTETINCENRLGKNYAHFRYHTSDERLMTVTDTDAAACQRETTALVHGHVNVNDDTKTDSSTSKVSTPKPRKKAEGGSDASKRLSGVAYKPVLT